MKEIKNSPISSTVTFRLAPEIREFFMRLTPALKLASKKNDVTTNFTQGEIITDIVRFVLSSGEPAYRIGDSYKEVTFGELLSNELEDNLTQIEGKMQERLLEFINYHSKINLKYLKDVGEPKDEEVYLVLDWGSFTDTCAKTVYPGGIAYIRLLDDTCSTNHEGTLREKLKNLIQKALDNSDISGRYDDKGNFQVLMRTY